MKLLGLKTIVTGASQGLGKEIARTFLAEGASVAICARNEAELAATAAELRQPCGEGQQVFAQAADVARRQDADAFVTAAADALGGVDVLVNNAGIHGAKTRIDDEAFDMDGWMAAVQVNLFGNVQMCHSAIPYLKEARRGKIINLSGGGATSPMPGMSAYAASKAAVVRLTETVAIELAEAGIDVNAVAPGAMNTRLLDDVLDNGKGKVTDQYYQKALQQKEDGGTPPGVAASLCAYLASAESDGVSGKLISAVWDDWKNLALHLKELDSDIYTLRRIVPSDRGLDF